MKQMKKSLQIVLFFIVIIMVSCSSINSFSRFDLIEFERKGNIITLDSVPINYESTYLNQNNISKLTRYNKNIDIKRKNKNLPFYSINDLKIQNKYNSKIDHITVNGSTLDSIEISNVKFESGTIQYIRLLTQLDYSGKEFDDLPQVKKAVGNGILIINTQ